MLRNDFRGDSDIDALVEFKPDCVSGFAFASMARELEEMFGRQVDAFTRSSVERIPNHIRRKEILASAKAFYADNQGIHF
ncbi:MAG: nucleotidyltransferase domain-containing protein [Betaproteobacteria bacterium]|nr:nucleotidyltransferase domain-containing protein [Betaproteobacteria bacterium]